MNLHEFPDDFKTLLLDVSIKNGVRPDILEKDYYVTLLLKELANKQQNLKAYFKGGTALYKALHSIKRFSEDIDLTVCIDDCDTKSARKARIERAAKDYNSLTPFDGVGNHTGSGSVTKLYKYDSLFDIESDDPLQRFGRVKIEATSFTKSEPFELMQIAPALYDLTTAEFKNMLTQKFDVAPFEIGTIKLERIFIDKVFAAEFYYSIDSERNYMEVSKHLYDLTVLMSHPKIIDLLNRKSDLEYLVTIKREEEKNRHNSNLSDKQFSEFSVYANWNNDDKRKKEFAAMQKIYVFNDADILTMEQVKVKLDNLWKIIKNLTF